MKRWQIKLLACLFVFACFAIAHAGEPVTGCSGPQGYASECPKPPEGHQVPNWQNYDPPADNPAVCRTPGCGREFILLDGGAWGTPFVAVCAGTGDTLVMVDGRATCLSPTGIGSQPEFLDLNGGYCDPYDASGYNACLKVHPNPYSTKRD